MSQLRGVSSSAGGLGRSSEPIETLQSRAREWEKKVCFILMHIIISCVSCVFRCVSTYEQSLCLSLSLAVRIYVNITLCRGWLLFSFLQFVPFVRVLCCTTHLHQSNSHRTLIIDDFHSDLHPLQIQRIN